MNVRLRPTAAAHAHHIEAHQVGQRSLHEPKWNHIRPHPAYSHHHGPLPDPHELAHSRLAAEHDEVPHRHMSAEYHVVGQGYIAANLAVMPDMRADHEQATIAHFRDAA